MLNIDNDNQDTDTVSKAMDCNFELRFIHSATPRVIAEGHLSTRKYSTGKFLGNRIVTKQTSSKPSLRHTPYNATPNPSTISSWWRCRKHSSS